MNTLLICLSFMSLSAVLASISVALRNFAFSALIQPEIDAVRVGGKKYKDTLKKSSVIATFTGIVFIVNTFIALIVAWFSLSLESTAQPMAALTPFYALMPLFIVGMVSFLICLIWGYLKFDVPERAETEEATP